MLANASIQTTMPQAWRLCAGTPASCRHGWIPAFAGMTNAGLRHSSRSIDFERQIRDPFT
jgi:hypothetical protein